MTEKSSLPFFRRFLKQPYQTVNDLDLSFHGIQFNVFRDDVKLRKKLLIPIIAGVVVWFLMGFDSSEYQIEAAFTALVSGQSWNQIIFAYSDAYGKYLHWSALVIYGAVFYFLSKYLHDKLDVVNCENICISAGLTLFAVSVFEFWWMGSYYYFQNQSWILNPRFPQLRIHIQNIAFMGVGLLILGGLDWRKVKLNFERKTWAYLIVTIGLMVFWWGYGYWLPVQQFSINVLGYGTWTNSIHFPQTVYTVDLNVLDNLAVGEQYYIENNLIHLVNVVTKVFLTLFTYNLFKLKRK